MAFRCVDFAIPACTTGARFLNILGVGIAAGSRTRLLVAAPRMNFCGLSQHGMRLSLLSRHTIFWKCSPCSRCANCCRNHLTFFKIMVPNSDVWLNSAYFVLKESSTAPRSKFIGSNSIRRTGSSANRMHTLELKVWLLYSGGHVISAEARQRTAKITRSSVLHYSSFLQLEHAADKHSSPSSSIRSGNYVI